MHATGPHRRKHRAHVQPRGHEQLLAQRSTAPRTGRVPAKTGQSDQPAHQAVAVGMHPVRGQPQQHVTRRNPRGQALPALHRAHGKPGKIEIARRVHPRHLGCLAADQRASACGAALRDAFDHRCGHLGIQRAGGEIIQKEQGLCTLADQIVHAHGHKVHAHGIDDARVDGDAQLGAHAIGGGHQDRIGVPGGLEIEEPAKTAQPRHDPGPMGRGRGGLDPLDQRIARVNIHPRIRVGQPVLAIAHPALLCRAALAHRVMRSKVRVSRRGLGRSHAGVWAAASGLGCLASCFGARSKPGRGARHRPPTSRAPSRVKPPLTLICLTCRARLVVRTAQRAGHVGL